MNGPEVYTVLNPQGSPAEAEFEERRSRFIGNCWHIDSNDDVAAILEEMHIQHPKARHIAYATIWGDSPAKQSERMSDDGEPSGTAGKPILDCIRHQHLIDCMVTVTRYFGGVLLGSGGLIRAYSTAASSALHAARIARLVPSAVYRFALAYSQLELCKRVVADEEGLFEVVEYSDHIEAQATVPESKTRLFENRITQSFNATVSLKRAGSKNVPIPV